MFNEKLDFLMNVTKTSNSNLARHASLDASYISRLRRGKRKLAENENYVKKMADYFYRQCVEEYQKKAVIQALGMPEVFFEDQKEVIDLIHRWLLTDKKEQSSVIEGFLGGLSNFKFENVKRKQDVYAENTGLPDIPTSVYYGNEGKKEAVIALLSSMIKVEKIQTLLLYSDEDMDWLLGDPAFAFKWADLLKQVIMKGNRIKIIHTVSRDLDEMLEALSKWMPLYMTGSIEPYYYPKKRDGIFKRTLFVAPETAALTSTSIGRSSEKAVNLLFQDCRSLESLTEEFNNYLKLCKPLMRIYTPRYKPEYLKVLGEFEKEYANTILRTESLCMATIPLNIAEIMLARTKESHVDEIINYIGERKTDFEKNLQEHKFIEIIKIPEFTELIEGKIKLDFSCVLDVRDLFYRPEEFKSHLENVVRYLKDFENYNVIIERKTKKEGNILYVKEDLGAIVVKTLDPFAVFAINENNMTVSLWDYLNHIAENSKQNKQNVIMELEKVINSIS